MSLPGIANLWPRTPKQRNRLSEHNLHCFEFYEGPLVHLFIYLNVASLLQRHRSYIGKTQRVAVRRRK